MKKILQTDKKVETGLIIRKDNLFEKIKRKARGIIFWQEVKFNRIIESFVKEKPKGKVIIPKVMCK